MMRVLIRNPGRILGESGLATLGFPTLGLKIFVATDSFAKGEEREKWSEFMYSTASIGYLMSQGELTIHLSI